MVFSDLVTRKPKTLLRSGSRDRLAGRDVRPARTSRDPDRPWGSRRAHGRQHPRASHRRWDGADRDHGGPSSGVSHIPQRAAAPGTPYGHHGAGGSRPRYHHDYRRPLARPRPLLRGAYRRRRRLGRQRAAAASQIDMAVADVEGVARAAVRAVRRNSPALETLSEAILDLARAVEALATYLEKPGTTEEVSRLVLKE